MICSCILDDDDVDVDSYTCKDVPPMIKIECFSWELRGKQNNDDEIARPSQT